MSGELKSINATIGRLEIRCNPLMLIHRYSSAIDSTVKYCMWQHHLFDTTMKDTTIKY